MQISLKDYLEELYQNYNRRDFVNPDPLQFLYLYDDPRDIEIAAMVGASLAYGRVEIIVKNLSSIFAKTGKPFQYILRKKESDIKSDFVDFKHRFTTGREISDMFILLKRIYDSGLSLFDFFYNIYRNSDNNLIVTLQKFSNHFSSCDSLIPDVCKGSACKRLFLMLRWLVRKDNVDLGLWDKLPSSELIIPLDTHMLNISLKLNFIKTKCNSLKNAIEVTEKFKKINSMDPVKYDFVLTRFGIRRDFDINQLVFLS